MIPRQPVSSWQPTAEDGANSVRIDWFWEMRVETLFINLFSHIQREEVFSFHLLSGISTKEEKTFNDLPNFHPGRTRW